MARSVTLAALFGLVSTAVAAGEIPEGKRVSGYNQMSAATRAIQDDDTLNPGIFWVLDGEALWKARAGKGGKSCGDCHGAAPTSMKGVATRYPAIDPRRGRPVNLEGRINICRSEHQEAPALAYESKELLALTTYVAHQSRGLPIAQAPAELARTIDIGRTFFQMRQGQLNLSCALCHDDNWGGRLGGNTIPQGHPNGYPLYRLEWQTVGSLHRRLRNCLTGMRAETPLAGSDELVALEAYLVHRARGLAIETPAVRP